MSSAACLKRLGNKNGVGNQNGLGYKHTAEARAQIGTFRKGRPRLIGPEWRAKIVAGHVGLKHTAATKLRMSIAQKARFARSKP